MRNPIPRVIGFNCCNQIADDFFNHGRAYVRQPFQLSLESCFLRKSQGRLCERITDLLDHLSIVGRDSANQRDRRDHSGIEHDYFQGVGFRADNRQKRDLEPKLRPKQSSKGDRAPPNDREPDYGVGLLDDRPLP